MAVQSLESRVEALLSRQVAAPKTSGVPASTSEAAAVFDSIALNLILKPRTALYFALLAANGLRKAVADELASVAALKTAIQDLGNPAYRIEGATQLNQARTALVQLEGLPRLSSTNQSFARFDQAVSSFLNDELSKNVRRPGATSLSRTSVEAAWDLASSLAAIETGHTDLLQRLFKLAVGVDNFLSAPINALFSRNALFRARTDLDDIIKLVDAGGDPGAARDVATRLIADRSTLRMLGTTVDPFAAVISGVVPTANAPAVVTSAAGPFAASTGLAWSISTSAGTASGNLFELVGVVQTLLPGGEPTAVFPTNLGGSFFLSAGGATYRVAMNVVFNNISDVATRINAAGVPGVHASVYAGTRLVLYTDTPAAVSIAPGCYTGGVMYTDSVHALLGFAVGQESSTSLQAPDVIAAMSAATSLVSMAATSDGRIQITSLLSGYGEYIDATIPLLGLSGRTPAASDQLLLNSSAHQAQPGDSVTVSGVVTTVADVSPTAITLTSPVPVSNGAVVGRSALVFAYQNVIAALSSFFSTQSSNVYMQGIEALRRALAPLPGSQTLAMRNVALVEAGRLEAFLSALAAALSSPNTALSAGSAAEEKRIGDGILQTLLERGYDRAADLFLRCELHTVLELDADSASYAGQFLSASSVFAQSDIGVKNTDQENIQLSTFVGRT